jgi:aspartyl-tRNA(Asn)/glutamyl-tRNA(Gln) amidotransferase subunit A
VTIAEPKCVPRVPPERREDAHVATVQRLTIAYFRLPTISVPCGFTNSGLPIGLQMSGAPFAESTVVPLAHAYERETGWHKRRAHLTPA